MTPHNRAAKEKIAKQVLLPGDPNRAAWVAENFLEESHEVTNVRGMLGFTGLYKGKPVTVMGSGMGGPSAGIYSYELFSAYEVEAIIRIGTCGGFQSQVEVGDLIFALSASTDSNWAHQYNLKGSYSPTVDYPLLERAVEVAKERQIPYHCGGVFSSDLFSDYNALGADSWQEWAKMGLLAQDMESYALYSTAAYLGKRALSILTMTDSCLTGLGLLDDQRVSALRPMVEIALEVAYS